MEYTLCNNSECKLKDDCLRWKIYNQQAFVGVINEHQLPIKAFEPFDELICKYKLTKDNI